MIMIWNFHRLTVTNYALENIDMDSAMFFEEEEIIILGKSRIVRRLYVSHPNNGCGYLLLQSILVYT